MRFVPYPELDDTPNVVVDGAAAPSTVLTLSHWPHSGSPIELREDLSAQIAFRYLERPDLRVEADAVSNNHFDEDGLVSLWALVDPAGATDRRELAVDLAAAGDFATFRHRAAARASFTIAALVDPDRSPLDPATLALPYDERCGVLYHELLPRVGELLDHPDRLRALWADEDAHLDESEAAIANGTVRIDEHDGLDLAIVTAPATWSERTVHRFTQARRQAVHPMAVHNATDRFRLVLVEGRRYRFQYRYESWVQYASRRPAPRVDLTALAGELSADEPSGAWTFDGVAAIGPELHLVGAEESAIPPEQFVERLTDTLRTGAPAWDPYD